MRTYFVILGIFLLMTACNKVNQHYALVDGQPWISAGQYNIGPGGTLPTYNYPSTIYVGDTMSMYGKMFIDAGGVLKIGSVTPTFVYKYKSSDSVDLVRFIITKEMGVGKNISVTLTVPGTTIQAPSITILQLSGVLAQTDTTLFVDSITSWQPANLILYQQNSIPLIIGSSVSGGGTVYFDNPLGVFSVIGGSVQSVLSVGNQLTDSAGSFTVNKVLGSVISNDGNTLAFSAEVSDNSDTLSNYVFRLCTMNTSSKAITTLNRTLEPRGTPAQTASPGAFTGPAAQVNLVAISIKTDINGNWYFSNIYAVPYTGISMDNWFGGITDNMPAEQENNLDNICELGTDGKIKSLFSEQNGYYQQFFKTPGFPIAEINGTLISTDGSTAFIHTVNSFSLSMVNEAQYNLNLQVPLSAPGVAANYRFLSYDTSTVTGLPGQNISLPVAAYAFPNGCPNILIPLANGYVLSNDGTPSLFAFNILNQTFFCYAGTEAGMLSGVPAVQSQSTGPAKYVNFALNGNATYFNGTDNTGAVYYYTAPSISVNGYGGSVLGPPITFYKLYSKK